LAKGKKKQRQARGVSQEVFNGFIASVASTKQDVDDATTANAGAWKKADTLGIHPEAAKLYLRLDRMEDLKRADFLRSFDIYRGWADWSAQVDMFEQQEDRDPAPSAPPLRLVDAESGEPIEGGETGGESGPIVTSEELLEQQKLDADVGEENPIQSTEDLENAGYTFGAGKQAAIEGEPVEANPHPEHSPSHALWARGHAVGMALPAEEEAEKEPAPPTGRGRRRGAAESLQPAIH